MIIGGSFIWDEIKYTKLGDAIGVFLGLAILAGIICTVLAAVGLI